RHTIASLGQGYGRLAAWLEGDRDRGVNTTRQDVVNAPTPPTSPTNQGASPPISMTSNTREVLLPGDSDTSALGNGKEGAASTTAEEASMAELGLPCGFKPQEKAEADDTPGGELTDTFTIVAAQAGQKLAKLCATRIGCSRNAAAAMVRDGRIRVNSERSGANRVLECGDVITMYAEVEPEPTPDCPLATTEIQRRVNERMQAKAVRDFETADRLHKELSACGVHIIDRTHSWKALDGRRGTMGDPTIGVGEPSGEVIAAPVGAGTTPAAAAGIAPCGSQDVKTTAEAERRRLKNQKKREGRVKKAAAAGNEASESTAAAVQEEEPALSLKRKGAPGAQLDV
ncbi:hypothetical protein CYMTET_6808, partial [Cymbomonas tetramitiformis]